MRASIKLMLPFCAVLALALSACEAPLPPKWRLVPPEGQYDVTILRDSWGVPHIYGETDADVAYGLAYANSEDDFKTIQEGLLMARGRLAAYQGRDMAPFDYLVGLFRFREIVEREYEEQLSPETRAICEAYADGINHYVAMHPEEAIGELYPATGVDVVMGFVAKTPLFFGVEGELRRLMGDTRARDISEQTTPSLARAGNTLSRGLPMGSNAFSVAPSRATNGETLLAVNSHQPWEGPVAWYETRLKSAEGLDVVGGVFPGTPVILHGHNRNLGWAHTVNQPDLVDIYVLEINPDNPNQYRFDGEWLDLEAREVPITVRLWGNLRWTFRQEALHSVHGPVVRRPHGVYAIRYAGYGDIRQVEQWYRMNKARDIDAFEEAMRMRAVPSFNTAYADREGNIWYIYNALLPRRAEGWDWRQYLPGDTSETLWTEYIDFEEMPQVRNPASGFVQNCNNTPFQTTLGPENPNEEDFSPTHGIETHMTNRGLRAMELLGADEAITEEAFYAYKYDLRYSENSFAKSIGEELLAMDFEDDPVAKAGLEALAAWDLNTDLENPNTAIAVMAMEPIVRAEMFGQPRPDPRATFTRAAHRLHDAFGRVDPPWGEVNRLVRGDVNLPLAGGPDVLHAVYGEWDEERGHLVGRAGDCYVLMVTWNSEGNLRSRSIHQYGSATMDPESPHYADQAPLFAARETKPVWLDEDELRENLQAEYRPGESWQAR